MSSIYYLKKTWALILLTSIVPSLFWPAYSHGAREWEAFRGDEEQLLGWHSGSYGQLEPCWTLRARTTGTPPTTPYLFSTCRTHFPKVWGHHAASRSRMR